MDDLNKLRDELLGAVELADSAEALAKRFARKSGRHGTLIVARLTGGHRAFLVDPTDPRGSHAIDEVVGDEGFEPPTSSL